MNTPQQTNHHQELHPKGLIGIAGIAYAAVILLAFFQLEQIQLARLVPLESSPGVKVDEWMFRLGLFAELLMFSSVMVIAWSLHGFFKHSSPLLAHLAFTFRVSEAIVGAIAAFCALVVLALYQSETLLSHFSDQQKQDLMAFWLSIRGHLYVLTIFLMSVGAVIFFALFLKQRQIPLILSCWGLFTYLSMFVYASAEVLSRDVPTLFTYLMYVGALFELVIGLYLIYRGFISSKPIESAPLTSEGLQADLS